MGGRKGQKSSFKNKRQGISFIARNLLGNPAEGEGKSGPPSAFIPSSFISFWYDASPAPPDCPFPRGFGKGG